MERRKQALYDLQPIFDNIETEFKQLANLPELKYASDLRKLCNILSYELYQKAPDSDVPQGTQVE
mgnify:CR=1 FL=1